MLSSPGDRPNAAPSAEDLAAWETKRFARLRKYAPPAAGRPVLDDLIPDVDEMLADPELARRTIGDELPGIRPA